MKKVAPNPFGGEDEVLYDSDSTESHSRGTAVELQLSRKLANEIEWVIQSGGVMPVQIRNAYDELKKYYEVQMENEEYRNSTQFPEQLQTDLFE